MEWLTVLNLSPYSQAIVKADWSDEAVQKNAPKLAAKVRKLIQHPIFDEEDRLAAEEPIEEIEQARNKAQLMAALDILYDWADYGHRCWIKPSWRGLDKT